MQKLTRCSSGSALLGTVVLCTIMAIAGLAFLQLAANRSGYQADYLRERQRFQAAESGIWIGCKMHQGGIAPPLTCIIGGDTVIIDYITGIDTVITDSISGTAPAGSLRKITAIKSGTLLREWTEQYK